MFLKIFKAWHHGVPDFLVTILAFPTFHCFGDEILFFGPRGVRRWFEPQHISNTLVKGVGVLCSLFGALRGSVPWFFPIGGF